MEKPIRILRSPVFEPPPPEQAARPRATTIATTGYGRWFRIFIVSSASAAAE